MVTTVKDYEKLSEQYNKMIAERDTLIDDLSWYKAKVSRLERENEKYDEQFTEYIDETYMYLKLLSEISQHIGNKPSSSTYKYFRAKLDGVGIKEGE
ncbi:hypothetical protein NGH46_06675 [Staphylococcus xylosus]|uniref:hypothetical protein n=1 Tax=Staphylococcus xylosus TaxID=1288 RepID=UPI002DBF5832|nr:hypothetical protein [Staphylococcus xylosus]MEB8121801.1 hypothetical protein [Staphylococcus xylosus]